MNRTATYAIGLLLLGPGAVSAMQSPATGDRYTERVPGTEVVFDMAYVRGGTFVLGSPDSEVGRDEDEGPTRSVSVTGFWIGVHEVTHDEYAIFRNARLDSDSTAVPGYALDVDAVSRPSPPYEDPAHGLGQGRHPAVGMTQWAALQYARWLSEKTGRLYRLPTEAEWEFACRAGGAGPHGLPDGVELTDHAWFADTGDETHHPVGLKAPNDVGVHDMLGNVAEWTLDQYRGDAYETLTDGAADPWSTPDARQPRTVRGGAFDDGPEQLRCADRLESTPRWKRRDPQIPKSRWWNTDSPHVGFRLVAPAGDWTLETIQAYWADLLDEGP